MGEEGRGIGEEVVVGRGSFEFFFEGECREGEEDALGVG